MTTELAFCKLLQSMLGVTTSGSQDHNFAVEPLSAPDPEPLSDPTRLKSCEWFDNMLRKGLRPYLLCVVPSQLPPADGR